MNKLAYYLRRTAAKTVHVNREQVVELIGEEKAEELSLFNVGKSEIKVGRVGKRSAIPANKKVMNTGLSGFDRAQLLEAIDDAKGSDYQASDGPEFNAAPNPDLLPRKERMVLEARNVI